MSCPPGQAICPYQYEYGEEEWLLVLEGRPSIRHPKGGDQLEPWDAVCLRSGAEGAHAVRNGTDETVRVLIVLDREPSRGDGLPRQRQVAIWTSNRADDLMTTRSSSVDYWFGEVDLS